VVMSEFNSEWSFSVPLFDPTLLYEVSDDILLYFQMDA
jgi:hypothetical protein